MMKGFTPGKDLSPDDKVRLLLNLSQRLSGTFDLQDLLQSLLEAARTAVAFDAAGIYVLNRSVPVPWESRGYLIAGMASVGFDELPQEEDPMLREGKGIIGRVIATGQTLILDDVHLDADYVEARRATRSEIAVPIVSNNQVIGAFNLESDRRAAYSAEDAALLEFFATVAALSIEKALLLRQVLEKQRLEQQLALARMVQGALLPSQPPRVAGYDLAGTNIPTGEVGGDYFDYIPLEDGRLVLAVADVSGKGIPAALIMATFRAALRTALQSERDLLRLAETLDGVLRASCDPARFVTAVLGLLDPREGGFHYVNCGHNPPMRVRRGAEREDLETGRIVLGALDGEQAEFGHTALQPGDLLVLYTDGVTEVADAGGEEFGPERLEALVRERAAASAREIVEAVTAAARAYAGHDRFDDDFTLVVLRRE
ncbi:MAG: SpoIIE family protein phosphatase [Acidobacteria bacterium]|nr:SpoIIE family protein phosphatase [Acidobacteriota bacterium]